MTKENTMKVKNINGTSDKACTCGSWLDHWKNFSGQSVPIYCPEVECPRKPEVGAHVQKDNGIDSRWYIVPLCETHNALTGKSLNISENIKLASANVSLTCGK